MALSPVVWAWLEAEDQARRSAPGPEHLLLAVLTCHEVEYSLPHLLPENAESVYAGGRVLAELGVTHGRVKDVLLADLDPAVRRATLDSVATEALASAGIDLDNILERADTTFDRGALASIDGKTQSKEMSQFLRRIVLEAGDGTGTLVLRLVEHGGPAADLVRRLGVDVAVLCERLAEATS